VPTLQELIDTLPQIGTVEWIGVRPARKAPMNCVQTIKATPELGLEGDRYSGTSRSRQVTLIQAEHLDVLESVLNCPSIQPELLRRNVLVRGINLLALKNKNIQLGSIVMRVTGLCHPCSRMETLLGPGGYNAMRGHGGITASVIASGQMRVGDEVKMKPICNTE